MAHTHRWPADLSDVEIIRRLVALNAERAQAVRSALATRPNPATAAELCEQFKSPKPERVAELLKGWHSLKLPRPRRHRRSRPVRHSRRGAPVHRETRRGSRRHVRKRPERRVATRKECERREEMMECGSF